MASRAYGWAHYGQAMRDVAQARRYTLSWLADMVYAKIVESALDTGNWAGIGTYGGNLSVDWLRITERTA